MQIRVTLLLLVASPLYAQPERAEILERMEQVMGPLPGPERKVPLDVKVLSEEKLEGYKRKQITYAVEKGDRVPAYLLIPTGLTGKRPAVLCLHQTVALGKGEPVGLDKDMNKHYALELVKRGYVCLVPDYPSFGDYKYDFAKSKFQSGTMKAIWNNMRGIDLLQALPEVDGERIGAIGHSLGGHNAMFTAAFDMRIRAIVSCCGFCSFYKYKGGDLKGWASARYMPRIASVYMNDPKKLPFDFTDVVASFAPRAFLAIAPVRDDNFAVDGVKDVMKSARPAYAKSKAAEELQARYPDSTHDFPEAERKAAYEFLDKRLRGDRRRADAFPDYRPIRDWAKVPAEIKLGPVSAVATDAKDRVYVAQRGPRPILVFERDGTFIRSWGDHDIKTVHGLRLDPDGNVWVTDIGNHVVMKFDPLGKLLLSLGTKGKPGDKPDQFDQPTDIAVTPTGDIYVSDGYGNARVMKFDRTGKLLKQWGTPGKGDGQFDLPHAICLDAKGRVYVGDRENNRVQIFDAEGKFLEQWKESGAPYGLFLAGDRLFVADGRAGWIRVLGPDGKTLGRFGEKGTAAGQFQMPHMLCVDSHCDVYVAEVDNKRIQKFTARAGAAGR